MSMLIIQKYNKYRQFRILMRQTKNSGIVTKNNMISSTYRVEADQKQIIVEKLRLQLESLKKNQQQFVLLKQQYADLDRKYRAQLQEKNLLNADFKNRHDSALRHIGQLRNQSEAIKAEIRDKRIQIEDLKSDQQSLKNQLDQKNIDIQKLRIEVNSQLWDTKQLQNQRIALIEQIENLRKNNSALSEQLFNLQRQNLSSHNRLAELEKYYEQLQTQSSILKSKIQSYENTNNQMDQQIQDTINELSDLDNHLMESQRNILELQNANASIGSNSDQYKSQSTHNLKAAQAETMKNNDLVKKLKQSQYALKIRSAQVEEGHQEIQSLKCQNQELENINNDLTEDLQACRKHLQNLALLNKTLLHSLQNFSQQDTKVQQLIKRDHRVKHLGRRVQQTSDMDLYQGKDTSRTDVSVTTSRRIRF